MLYRSKRYMYNLRGKTQLLATVEIGIVYKMYFVILSRFINMAEGGDLTSIKDGSDADFVYTCSPCGEENVTEEAVKYCPVCEEYLCTTCLRHHGRLKASRSHTVQDCDASTKGSTVTMVTKCRYHPDRDIEMYCGEHDMVYCTKCIATNHRACSGILNLEDVNIS
ncbi:transcription intermediary factor 1-alpha-like, partial [Ruditapes philippinarum]|uniref:transcription intermediary factor 1-alpha-like n=1 Tax=Ruditapes philippinarum TaxID=129788 RepID=UPI00295A6761